MVPLLQDAISSRDALLGHILAGVTEQETGEADRGRPAMHRTGAEEGAPLASCCPQIMVSLGPSRGPKGHHPPARVVVVRHRALLRHALVVQAERVVSACGQDGLVACMHICTVVLLAWLLTPLHTHPLHYTGRGVLSHCSKA